MSKRIFIGNLPFRTTGQDLEELFESYGEIVDAQIERSSNGRHRGFGFVEMKEEEAANKAIEELDGYELFNRVLTVSVDENAKYFKKLEGDMNARPTCTACGDPVKIVFHSGGVPMAAQHCKDCYAELRWGKVPKPRGRRSF